MPTEPAARREDVMSSAGCPAEETFDPLSPAGGRPGSRDVASKLDFGTVWVNAHLVPASEVPWGGFKGSGYGRDLSIYALDDSRTKHVMYSVVR